MTLSMASENSHEIEIVTANFYFSVRHRGRIPLVENDGAVESLTVSMTKGRNRRAINEEKSPPAI
jgi:hypothetical protein